MGTKRPDDMIRHAFLRKAGPCVGCGETIPRGYLYRIEPEGLRCEVCLTKLDPSALMVRYRLTADTYTPDGERDAFVLIAPPCATLEEIYQVAGKLDTHLNIEKWYVRPGISHGVTLFKGWTRYLKPIEELRARELR